MKRFFGIVVLLLAAASPRRCAAAHLELRDHRQRIRLPGIRHQREQNNAVSRAPVSLPRARARPIRTPKASCAATSPSTSTSACAAAARAAGSTRRRPPAIPATSTSRTSSTRRRRSARSTAESYFFAPFDYPGNAMVALLKAPGASDGFVLFNFHMGTATTPDSPGADGESIRYVTAQQSRSSRPARAAASSSTCRSRASTPPTARTPTRKVMGGHGSGAEHVVQRQRRRPRLPEEARRRRLDGRRRRLRRQHQPRRRRRRRRVDDDVGQQPRARPAARRRARRVRGVAQAAAVDGAAVRRRRDASCGASREAVLRMGQIREANTATRKNNGMMLASLPPGIVAHRLGARRHLRRRRAGALGPLRRSQGRAQLLPERRPGRRATRATRTTSTIASRSRATSATARRSATGTTPGPTSRPTAGASCCGRRAPYVEASGDTAWLSSSATSGAVYDVLQSRRRRRRSRQPRDLGHRRAPTRRSGRCTSRASTTRSPRWRRRAASATWRRWRRRRARAADVTHYAMLSQKVNSGVSVGRSSIRRGRSADRSRGCRRRSTTTARVAEAFDWNLLADFGGADRDGDADAVQPPARRLGRLQAQRRRPVVVRQQRVDPGRPAHLERAAPRRQDQRRRRLPRADRQQGGGQLLPSARALQRHRGRRADRQVLRLDPDGRLRRRRVSS